MLRYKVTDSSLSMLLAGFPWTIRKRVLLFFWEDTNTHFSSYEHACLEVEILNNKEKT